MMTELTNLRDILRGLAHNVKQRRAELGITQEQLAELAGLSHNYVARIELGLRHPSIATLAALADALDAEVGDLFAKDRLREERVAGTYYVDAALAHLSTVDRDLVMKMLTTLVRRLQKD